MAKKKKASPPAGPAPERPGFHLLASARVLWIVLGVVLVISFFLPTGSETGFRGRVTTSYFWDAFGERSESTALGTLAVYMMIAGMAVAVVAYVVEGLPRGIAFLSIGVMGEVILLVAIGGEAEAGRHRVLDIGEAGGAIIVGIIALLALAAALTGNNIKLANRGSKPGRLLAGIGAGAGGIFFVLTLVFSLTAISDSRDGLGAGAITFVATVISMLALVAACIMMVVNLKEHSKSETLCAVAQKMAFVALAVLGAGLAFWPVFEAPRNASKFWLMLLNTRMVIFLYVLMTMTAAGLAEVLRHAVPEKRSKAAAAR